jgi:hypothetical protein
MPVQRKQQILAKIETSEGVDATPVGADAVQIWDPQRPQDDVDNQDRVPAGPSLSRDFSPVGRRTRKMQFKTDFRGSADITIPISPPDFERFLLASGYKTATIRKLTFTTITSGSGFEVGEIVQTAAGANRAVVLGCFDGSNNLLQRLTGAGHIAVAVITGVFTSTALTTGESTGTTATSSAVAAYEGLCYQTTSDKTINFTVSSWTGSAPSGTYTTLKVTRSGIWVGTALIIVDNSAGPMTDLDVTLLWGSLLTGDTVTSVGGGTATTVGVTMKRTPSLTINHNLDGRLRKLLGARGDYSLDGEVGQVMQFNWSFTGDVGTSSDAAPAATSGLSAVSPPRLLGAQVTYGLVASTSQAVPLPTKKVSVNGGGTVNPNLDANRAGGATGSNVTDRDPSIAVSVDETNSAFDWEAYLDAGTQIRFGALLGSAKGNICGIVAPRCQVSAATGGEANGIATAEVTLKPRRILEAGDDELYIFQI